MFKNVNYIDDFQPKDEKVEIAKEFSDKVIRILLTGGGSGGHTNPLLAVAEAIRAIASQQRISLILRYIGPQDEHSLVIKASQIEVQSLIGAKWRRYGSIKNIIDIPLFFISIFQALFKILFFMPDVIFSKGGTGSLPVTLVGWLYRIPVVIHESDAIPGLANAISGRFAKRIAVSFERAKNYFPPKKTAIIGTPIISSLLTDILSKNAAKKLLGFESDQPVILVIGGSQGAQAINEFIVTNLEEITALTQVIHQTGSSNFSDMQKLSKAALLEISTQTGLPKRYRIVPYLQTEEMKHALAAADIVVSRCGSASLFEIAAFKKPAILIPLPGSARDHQRVNGYEFVKSGGAVVIEQINLIPGIFLNQLKDIIEHQDVAEAMSKGSESFFKPHAAEILAQEIIKIVLKR